MKKIEAIISPKNLEGVQEGLKAAGIVGRLMVTAVCRLQRSCAPSAPDLSLDRDLVRSLKVELIVSDYLTCKAINAIFDYTCSQEKDLAVGQITVLPIETTLQIGEEGL